MSTKNSPKFGVLFSFMFGLHRYDFIANQAMLVDSLGFDSLWVPDHLFSSEEWTVLYGGDPKKLGLLEPWTTLAALAAITKKVEVGTLVSPITLRNPGIMAKMASTIDHISNGRLNLGLGAGWNKNEFKSYGIKWDNFSTRIEKLDESIQLIKKLWLDSEPIYFDGKYYQMTNAHFWPKPVRKPFPPIYLGGTSSSILKITGKYGDGWIPYQPSIDKFKTSMKKIKDYSKKYERSNKSILGGSVFQCIIQETTKEADKLADSLKWPNEELRYNSLIGSADDIIVTLEKYVKAGMQEFIFVFPVINKSSIMMKMINNQIFPHFKEEIPHTISIL